MRPQTRMTRQRMMILEALRSVHTHPTADDIYAMVRKRIPRISLGTVYRNLDFLAENGTILKLESAGSIRRFDGFTHPHQHVRCTACGCITDVEIPMPVPEVHDIQVEGFQITGIRLEFEGLCAGCSAAQQHSAGQDMHNNSSTATPLM